MHTPRLLAAERVAPAIICLLSQHLQVEKPLLELVCITPQLSGCSVSGGLENLVTLSTPRDTEVSLCAKKLGCPWKNPQREAVSLFPHHEQRFPCADTAFTQ